MTDPLVRLSRAYHFEAAHLGLFENRDKLQVDQFTVEIHVGVDRSKMKGGVVVETKALDVYVAPVLARLRNQRLDQLEPRESFEPLVSFPTAENLALYLFDKLRFLGNDGLRSFLGVRVIETAVGQTWTVEVFR